MPPKPPTRIPQKPLYPPKPKANTPPFNIHVQPAPKLPRPKAQPQSANIRPPPPPPRAPNSRSWTSNQHSWPRYFLYWGGVGFVSACGILFIRDNIVSFDQVTGSSMAPTLNAQTHETGWKDRLLIRTEAAMRQHVNRGDIVTFWKPHKAEEISIKRVVAVGGDIVFPKRGFFVDGEFMGVRKVGLMDGLGSEEEEWGRGSGERGVKVPHGHIWVEGDNWRETLDSCEFGPISLGLVEGRAIRVWSWSRLGFYEIGDMRLSVDSRKGASRVVEGKSVVPEEYME